MSPVMYVMCNVYVFVYILNFIEVYGSKLRYIHLTALQNNIHITYTLTTI